MPVKKPADASTIEIQKVNTEEQLLALLGTSPIILNRLSEKAKRELLLPAGRKTSAQRQSTLKHNPLDEFRASPYLMPDDSDALLGIPSSAVKGAAMTAALDLPGARKAQIGRLVYVHGDLSPLYGLPEIFLSIVRSADMNRTPDVRSRAIIRQWVVLVRVRYVVPLLTHVSVANLISAGGVTSGIGDWRPEKGKGDHGQYEVVQISDPRVQELREHAGREAQQAALDAPVAYDQESSELLSWFDDEVQARGRGPRAVAS